MGTPRPRRGLSLHPQDPKSVQRGSGNRRGPAGRGDGHPRPRASPGWAGHQHAPAQQHQQQERANEHRQADRRNRVQAARLQRAAALSAGHRRHAGGGQVRGTRLRSGTGRACGHTHRLAAVAGGVPQPMHRQDGNRQHQRQQPAPRPAPCAAGASLPRSHPGSVAVRHRGLRPLPARCGSPVHTEPRPVPSAGRYRN